MAELPEVQVKEAQAGEFVTEAQVRKIVAEVLAAAKPRRKGPPSFLSHRGKKSNAPKKGGIS